MPKIHLEHDDVTWSVENQHAFDRAVSRLRDRLTRYSLHADLVARFERRGSKVQARLELQLPQDAQTATVVESTTDKALRASFDGLFRRFDAYTWNIDHGRWRPLTGRVRTGDTVAGYHEALMRYALPALHRLAAHDIQRLRDEELLSEDWLDPAEVIDAAIADKLPTFDGTLELPKATLELVRAVREELMARIAEIHEHQASDVSFDDPMQESLELDVDETGDFPIDLTALNLGDILGDPSRADPEDVVAERERRDQLVTALFQIRDPDRALFSQVVIDGWTEDVVAAAWNLPIGHIQRAVGRVANQISDALGDIEPEDVIEVYRRLGERLGEERKALERRMASTGSTEG